MTPHILHWLSTTAQAFLVHDIAVVEIGAHNINGRARDALRHAHWTGWDTEAGPGVDHVSRFHDTGTNYDLVVACECYEHDRHFWLTNREARHVVERSDAYYIVTTPANGFPYHSYGGDYYRFTEDAYRQVFFDGLAILDLRVIGEGQFQTVVGIARNP